MYKYLFCFLILFSCSMSSVLGQENRRNIRQSRRTNSTQSTSYNSNSGQNRRSSTSQSTSLDRILGISRNTSNTQSSSDRQNNAKQQESPESVAIKLIKYDISLDKYLANPTSYLFRGLPQVPPRGLSEAYDKMLQRLTDEAKDLVSSLMAQDISYKEYHKMSKSKREKANLPGEEPILASKIWDNRENYQNGENNSLGRKIRESENKEFAEVVENKAPSSFNQSNSDSNGKTISLVVSGEGNTKEEATKNALRSAIEQAFGTFVSANTSVINDELVRDEIVTVSSGNIQAYKEISSMEVDGVKNVTLQAIVSIGKLVSYAQNKGMQTELAGATFAMNKKIRELNKANEKKAIEHLMEQLDQIANQGLYDYSIETSDPRNSELAGYNVLDVIITASINDNGRYYFETLKNTLQSLELKTQENEEYNKTNDHSYMFELYGNPNNNINKEVKEGAFILRNPISNSKGSVYPIAHFINRSLFNFIVKDNLGNSYQLVYKKDKSFDPNSTGWIPTKNFIKEMDYWDVYNIEEGKAIRDYSHNSFYYQGSSINIFFAYYPYSRFSKSRTDSNPEFWKTHCFAPYGVNNRTYEIKLSQILHNSSSSQLFYYHKVRFGLIASYSDEQLMNLREIIVEPLK